MNSSFSRDTSWTIFASELVVVPLLRKKDYQTRKTESNDERDVAEADLLRSKAAKSSKNVRDDSEKAIEDL